MTHGELWYEFKFILSKEVLHNSLPNRMSRADAVRYYKAKLEVYWVEQDRTSTAEDIYGAHEAFKLIRSMYEDV